MDTILEFDQNILSNDPLGIILEAVERSIPSDLKKQLSNQVTRRKMLDNCGAKAFLLPDKLKFPIYNPNTCELDCRLLYATYLRARQHKGKFPGYADLAEKAKNLFKEASCTRQIGINLENETLALQDFLELID